YTPDLRQARLLSDTELRTAPIDTASGLSAPTPEEQAWLASHHRPIRSITYDGDFSDLEFLAQSLQGKRIVQLGESSHGSAEFSAIKVRVIKYLHEQLGYNVIAFESSLAGCHIEDLSLDQRPPQPRAGIGCVFTIWNTADLNELARYVYSTRQTATPLRLAGFDIQTSSARDSSDSMLTWISPVLDRVSSDLTNAAREAITTTVSDLQLMRTCITAHQSSCRPFDDLSSAHYQRLAQITSQLRALVDATPLASADREEIVFAWLAINSLSDRLRYLRQFIDDANAYAALRDPMMAENITRLAELAYPNEKIIVWAHNAHIANTFRDPENNPSMGTYLHTRWGDQLATIGIFMLRGVSMDTDLRTPITVKSPLSGSLEAYTYSLRLGALYLSVPLINAAGSGDDWLHRPIRYYHWGAYERTGTMAGSFDGLIVIDRSTLPVYN
ncbi:MAG: erythromycin esterase family protein, partial [Dokdonella sp.]